MDPAADQVRFDLVSLLANSNVDTNQETTAAGCMSEASDEDCAPLFEALGLDFVSGEPTTEQQVFRVEPR